jgi:hypothetical protein
VDPADVVVVQLERFLTVNLLHRFTYKTM